MIDQATSDEELYVGLYVDKLTEHGLDSQILPPVIKPLDPAARMTGPAYTVEGRPNPNLEFADAAGAILNLFAAVPAGSVLVIQPNDFERSHFGEMSSRLLRARGGAGLVLDGYCRDARSIVDQGFPVFNRGVLPRDTFLWEVVAINEPVTVEHVTIAPGDRIVADLDGVVVVPGAIAEEVHGEVLALAMQEQEMRAQFDAGRPPIEVFRHLGIL